MTWEDPPHTRCTMPSSIMTAFARDGQVWRCDHPTCGQRYRLRKVYDEDGVRVRTEWDLL